jgi:uncharacterized protein YggE
LRSQSDRDQGDRERHFKEGMHMRWIVVALLVFGIALTPAAGQSSDPGRNQISTTGSGRIEVQPDVAVVTVGGQAQQPSAAEAMASVAKTADQVVAKWRQMGVRSEDIRTSAIQVFPVYSQPREGAPQITGYRATYMLTVTLTNIAMVGRAIDAAVEGGANMIQGVSFGLRDAARARADALAQAVRESREKAETLAQAAGLRIRGIDRIVESGVSVQPREMRFAPGVAASSVPIEPGLVSVTAQVGVVFNY